jgi:hypothetical protein
LPSCRQISSSKRAQFLIRAKDLFDHEVKWRGLVASRSTDQTAQPLAILGGVPEAVDVIKPKAVKPTFGDQSTN